MKVLYDIAVLGKGHHDPHFRTGIHRVVENIALGLAESEDCELNFCVSLSLDNMNQATDYLHANKRLEHVPFISLGIKKDFYTRLRGKIDKIFHQPKSAFTLNTLRNAFKLSRDSLQYARRRRDKSIQKLNPVHVSAIELYHSPFHPFPERDTLPRPIKRMVTIHDLIPLMYPQFYEFGYASSVEKVINSLEPDDWIISVSHSTKNDLCNYQKSIDPSRVVVTHLAASDIFYPCHNLEKISSVKKKFQIPDAPYIFGLNTLEPRKNISHTIRCFARLVEQEKIKDLYLVIVGRKSWGFDNILDTLSDVSSLRERIIMTGYVANEDLAPLYSGAMAFVFPSLYEGFGLPPLEAMQCGVPVITSNLSSLPEVVGDAGILVAPTDGDALSHSILELYRKPLLRENMSLKSIEQAKKFSWEKCTQETIQAYKTALDG